MTLFAWTMTMAEPLGERLRLGIDKEGRYHGKKPPGTGWRLYRRGKRGGQIWERNKTTTPKDAIQKQEKMHEASTKSKEDLAYGRPSKPEERKNILPPKLTMRPPPPPKGGKKKNKAGGFAANGLTNTEVGDAVEALTEKLGLRSILPPGRRANKDVAKEGSSLDREFDHSGYCFEVKACTTEAKEYKAKPKKKEMEDKRRFAKIHKVKPATMIAVIDYDKKEILAYWRPEIGAFSLTPTNLDKWSYMGSVPFGGEKK